MDTTCSHTHNEHKDHKHDHNHDHDHSHTAHAHTDSGHDHHGHDHGAHGHHHHPPKNTHSAFLIAVGLNGGLTILQIIYAFLAHSNSLLADAGHNFGDVLSLLFSWLAFYLSHKTSNARYSYGYKKSTILAALLNAAMLLIVSTLILVEAGYHLTQDIAVHPVPVMIVAGLAILINGGSALLFFKSSKDDLNLKSAFIHLLFDALTSLSVVVAAVLIYFTHLNWIDPLLGILITLFILKSSVVIFKLSLDLSLDGVPKNIDFAAVKTYLASIEGVSKVHDLHIWAMSTTETALTVHLTRPNGNFNATERHTISEVLRQRFKIGHTTLQVEEHIEEECEHEQTC